MKHSLTIMTLSVIISLAYSLDNCRCRGVFIKDRGHYKYEGIMGDIKKLTGLSYKGNNQLYYTYFEDDDTPAAAYISLHDNIKHPLNIRGANTIYADKERNVVFIGTTEGLYKLNSKGNARLYEVAGYNITSISVSTHVLYVADKKVYVFRDMHGSRYNSGIEIFAEYNVERIASSPNGAVIIITEEKRVGIMTSDLEMLEFEATTVGIDNDGTIFLSNKDGLHKLNDYNQFVMVNSYLKNLQEIVFTHDDTIIYARNDTLYKLKRFVFCA